MFVKNELQLQSNHSRHQDGRVKTVGFADDCLDLRACIIARIVGDLAASTVKATCKADACCGAFRVLGLGRLAPALLRSAFVEIFELVVAQDRWR